jgi:hypothetical protein
MLFRHPSASISRFSLCGLLLLLSVSPAVADPKPLSKEEQAKVDAAIDKGVAFLKKAQTKNGDWPRRYQGTYLAGQCALPAYALLESGVPTDDPVIQKAAEYLREKCKKTCYTYDLGLAILFFDRLGDPKDKSLIQSMALRLIAGQSYTGGWSYRCLPVKEKQEEALLNSLNELNKRLESGKLVQEAIRDLNVSQSFRLFAVFQDPRTFDLEEKGGYDVVKGGLPYIGVTDNSNTQIAMIGLWVSQRHEIPAKIVFRQTTERFKRSQIPDGRWSYRTASNASVSPTILAYRSMTCVGLIALAVGLGGEDSTSEKMKSDRNDLFVYRGLTALYRQIGYPKDAITKHITHQDVYFLWSLERVCMIYNLEKIDDKDWYRWGAEILLTNQLKEGYWPGSLWQKAAPPLPTEFDSSSVAPAFGASLNTAFALLFLKHSHPMKDLTTKLPFSAKELNEGIARLRRGEKLPERPSHIPNSTEKTKSRNEQ